MNRRRIGIGLYITLYIAACGSHFLNQPGYAFAAAAAGAFLFAALGAADSGFGGKSAALGYRFYSLAFLIAAILVACSLLPAPALLAVQALGLLWFAFGWRHDNRRRPRAIAAFFAFSCLVCLPVPGFYTTSPGGISDYSVSGKAGSLQAPGVERRLVLVGELLGAPWNEAAAQGEAARKADSDGNGVSIGSADADFADIEALYDLPFDVPDGFYELDGAEDDPHALIKLLARWNEMSAEDVTQGQVVMGIGSVAPDGTIMTPDDFEAYVKAASLAEPKVLFVPVEAYERARAVDEKLLVVPVKRFKEALYFLSEPVTFWPLRNFGLFCH